MMSFSESPKKKQGGGSPPMKSNLIRHRVPHRYGFTIITNEAIQDISISLKAKGLLHYILSLQEDWNRRSPLQYTIFGVLKSSRYAFSVFHSLQQIMVGSDLNITFFKFFMDLISHFYKPPHFCFCTAGVSGTVCKVFQ